jgi:hypothetical protein
MFILADKKTIYIEAQKILASIGIENGESKLLLVLF